MVQGDLISKVAIEHLDARPAFFVQFDKLQVPWCDLVQIMSGLILEHHMQRHVVIRVDRTIVTRFAPADGKLDRTLVSGQVFLTSIEQVIDRRIVAIFKREKNLVSESWHGEATLGGETRNKERGTRNEEQETRN